MSTRTTILDSFSSRHETPSHGNGIGLSQTSNIVPEGFANLLPPQRIPDLAPSLLLRSEFRFTLHQNVQRTYSICDAHTFKIVTAQLRSLCNRNSTEIMAFMSDLKPYRVWFSCWGKGCQLECKHNLIRKYEIFQLPTTRGNQDDDSKKLYLQTNNFIFGLIIYDRRDTNRLSWTVPSSVSTESSAK